MGDEMVEGLDDRLAAALLGALATSAEGYISAIDRQRRILFLNRTRSRNLSEVVGKPMEDFVVPDGRQKAIEAAEEAFRTGEPTAIRFEAVLADGSCRSLVMRIIPFSAPDGTQAALTLTDDETEHLELSRRLQETRELQQVVLENLPDFVGMVDREHRIEWVNHIAPDLTMEEVIGTKVEDFTTPETVPLVHAAIERAFEDGTIEHYEVVRRRGDTTAYYENRVVPIGQQQGPASVLVLTTDVTAARQAEQERLRLEQQVQHVQKLESLGMLAGGIAHDFNNLLTAILARAELASLDLSAGPRVREHLEDIRRTALLATDLTRQMLAYSGKGRFVVEPLALDQLVQELVHLLGTTLPKTAALRTDFAPDLPSVEADAAQMRQVIMNLVINAGEALGEQSGEVTITARAVRIDPGEGRWPGSHVELAAGDYVAIEVTDTGVGMDEETRAKIFEPFFSTKQQGRGLGLSAVLGIVRGHGGDLRVNSRPGEGSTFELRLPASDQAASAGAHSSKDAEPVPTAGTILVVDDEEPVRRIAVDVLLGAGFSVYTANDGRDALEVFGRHSEAIDLVLLDMNMPHLDGVATFRAMREVVPDVRVILSSGYTEQDSIGRVPGDRPAGFLQKPYGIKRLLSVVRSVLET